jgi:hypothetical protein
MAPTYTERVELYVLADQIRKDDCAIAGHGL